MKKCWPSFKIRNLVKNCNGFGLAHWVSHPGYATQLRKLSEYQNKKRFYLKDVSYEIFIEI